MRRVQNPVFSQIDTGSTHYEDVDAASYGGITLKTAILLGLAILVGAITAYYFPIMMLNNPNLLYGVTAVAGIVTFVAAMVGRLSTRAAKYAGVIYSAGEGLLLGSITAIFEILFPGNNISVLAVFSTVIIFAVMLVLYATGILRNCTFFRKLAYAMSFGAIALLLFTSIFSIFAGGIQNVGVLIGIEAFLLIYGAVTLIFNFDEATYIVQAGCSKDAEWSVSLGLTISLLYIYIEVLRLIALVIASSSDN